MSRKLMERAYTAACGKVAYWMALGDTKRLEFWVPRRNSLGRELGVM